MQQKKQKLWVQPLTHGRHSSCLETLFSQFLEQGCDPGHSGAAGSAAGATLLVAPPALSLASVYIYIFIYLSLSISLSHAALGMEEEQTAKQEVRMGAPICREQGHPGPRHPKAHSHTALTSTSGFFLAYILQQYRTSLPYPEPWRSRSSGTGADPVPAGAAVLAPTALSQPGAQAGQPGSGGSLGAAYSSHHPLACTGYPGVLPGLGVPPVWAGRAGGPCPLCHCCPTGAL